MDDRAFVDRLGAWISDHEAPAQRPGRVLAAPRILCGEDTLCFDEASRARAVDPLHGLAAPAVFGGGARTRRDPGVRSGLQLAAEAFQVEGLPLEPILQRLGTELFGAAPRATLHALQLYGRGDRFVRHKDTPRGAGHLGTLVVGLPSEHESGALVIADEVHDWSAPLAHPAVGRILRRRRSRSAAGHAGQPRHTLVRAPCGAVRDLAHGAQ